MKIAALVSMFLLAGAAATAQADPPSATAKAEMAKIANLAGKWRGSSWMDMPGGRRTTRSEEIVEMRLDGRALLIEGVHHEEKSGELVHHANALLAWDDRRREYRMASVLASGLTGTYSAKLEGDRLVWMLAGPTGPKRRFTIRVDGDRWVETGEISLDGATWKPFFEMTLAREK